MSSQFDDELLSDESFSDYFPFDPVCIKNTPVPGEHLNRGFREIFNQNLIYMYEFIVYRIRIFFIEKRAYTNSDPIGCRRLHFIVLLLRSEERRVGKVVN